jgi:hypothetical protein
MGGADKGAPDARSRALAVLRVRSRAVAVALLPAALAVILLTGATSGRLVGPGWDAARAVSGALAAVVLLAAVAVALVVTRARPAVSPTIPIPEESAPDLYRLVRDLADRLNVPAPSAIALTPDCDSWLEDRTHPAHGPPRPARHDETAGASDPAAPGARRTAAAAPVLVIGSPFLWWMRVGELRAVLAPVVAGTGPSAHPDIAAARRFVRGLDAAVAVSAAPGRGPVARWALAGVGWTARLLLRACRDDAAEMERGVAAAAADRAQAVDYGLRIIAQEQVGLAYAGWDRLLTRVALPAWRMGRWPSRLDAGVVAALTELSRRDRLAEGFTSRLGERPACDLLEEPGLVDEAASLLAARLFHGGPPGPGPDWSPVGWQEYPDEVVDRKWRTDAARLHRVLDTLGVRRYADQAVPHSLGPTLARVLDHLSTRGRGAAGTAAAAAPEAAATDGRTPPPADTVPPRPEAEAAETTGPEHTGPEHTGPEHTGPEHTGPETPGPELTGPETPGPDFTDPDAAETTERGAALAAGLSAELAREEAIAPTGQRQHGAAGGGTGPGSTGTPLWDDGTLPLFPLQPPRTGRELLTDHVTAMVCCAAVDTAGAVPGLDWLDGPSLLVGGERAADLGSRVRTLVENGDPAPLREWLTDLGIRPEKPVRLV